MSEIRFLKLQCTDTLRELLRDVPALHLLTVIALRARFTDEQNPAGLRFGQAMIGDHDAYGLTRKQERNARDRLARMRLVSFATSNRGTIATLLDTRVFSLRDQRRSQAKGQQGGQQQGQPSPEVISPKGANETATKSATEGPPGGASTQHDPGPAGPQHARQHVELTGMTGMTVAPATGGSRSKKMIPLPENIEAVCAYAESADIPRETAEAWWIQSCQSGFKINGKLINEWPLAFESWAAVDVMMSRPRADGLGNKAFWKWIADNGHSREVAIRYIRYNEQRGWKRLNPKTGRTAPIFDHKASFLAFLESMSPTEVMNMG